MSLLNCSCVFAKILDYYFQYNESSKLFELEGNSLSITIDELPEPLAIQIKQGKIEALDNEANNADVQISGNLKAIINMIREKNGLEADELYIQGKLSKAKQFHQLLSEIHLDWQQLFEKFVNKEKAEQFSKKAKTLDEVIRVQLNKGSDFLDTKLLNFVQKSEKTVTQKEFDTFSMQLSELNLCVENLHKIIEEITLQDKDS